MTIQRAATLYTCALVLLLPLVIVPGIDEFALLPRLLLYLFLSLILSVAVLILPGSARPTPRSISFPLLAFWGILAASALWATNPFRSTYDLAKHVPAFGMFFLLTRYLPASSLTTLLTCHAVTGLGVSVIGIAEYLDVMPFHIPSTGRPSATFAFRNLAGAYLATGTPLAVLLYYVSEDRWRKCLGLAAGSTMFLFLLYTRARASWFGLFTGVAVAGLVWFCVAWRTGTIPGFRTMVRWALSPTLLVAIVVLGLGLVPDRLNEKHTQRFDEKKSSMVTAMLSVTRQGGDRGRFKMWASTLDMIADYPVAGVGLGNWEYIYPPYDNGNQIQSTSSPHRPHNDLLWIWSETGTLGLLSFICLLLGLGHFAVTRLRAGLAASEVMTVLASVASMVAFLGVGMFSFPFERVPPEFNFWLAASLMCVVSRTGPRVASRARWEWGLPLVLAGALLISVRHTQHDYHYARAHLAYLKKDYQTAEAAAEKALRYGPFEHQAFLMIGDGAYHRQDWDYSEKNYHRALTYHPNFANAHNGLGLAALGRENYTEAKAHFNQTLRMVSNHHIALHNRGLVYERLGHPDSAIADYEKAIRTDHGAPLVNMAAIYRKQGKTDLAIATYERAVELHVPAVEAWFNLGNIYLEKKEFTKSGEAYSRFLQHWAKQDSVYEAAREGLSQSYSGYGVQMEMRGQPDSARIAYERAIEIAPSQYLNWFNLGNVLRKQGKLDEAIRAYQRALAINERHIDSYNNLGMTYRDLKRDQDAIAVYSRAQAIAPEDPIVNYNLGQTLMVAGEVERAEKALTVFRANWKDDPRLIHYYMGNVYTQSGRLAEARRAYQAFLTKWDRDDGIRRSAEGILKSITPGP